MRKLDLGESYFYFLWFMISFLIYFYKQLKVNESYEFGIRNFFFTFEAFSIFFNVQGFPLLFYL
jgi:hypothetical protein